MQPVSFDRDTVIRRAIDLLKEPAALATLLPVRAWDANDVEIGLRYCSRAWYGKRRASGGLMVWVTLPHLVGVHDQRKFTGRVRIGFTWDKVEDTLQGLYEDATAARRAIVNQLEVHYA